jgi:hypothetical protein
MTRMFAAFLAVLGLLGSALPAFAQWVAVGRWGNESNFRFVAPGTWMTLDTGFSGFEISAEGDNHVGRLTFWCRPDMQGGGLLLTQYLGPNLRQTLRDPAQVESETVTFVLGERRFDFALDLIEWERSWTANDILTREFLDAFGRANRLELRNADDEVVTGFRMNGSSAALSALRRRCGI